MAKKIKKVKTKTKTKQKQKQSQTQRVVINLGSSGKKSKGGRKRRRAITQPPPPPPEQPRTFRPQIINYDVNRQPPQAPRGGNVGIGGFIPPQFIYGTLGDNDRRGQDPRNDRRRERDDRAERERNDADRKRALRGRVVSGLRSDIRLSKQQGDINRMAIEAKEADRKIGSLSGIVEQQAGDLRKQEDRYRRGMDVSGDIIDGLESAMNRREQDVADGLQKESRLYSKIIDAEDEAQLERNIKDIAMERADQAQKTADDFEVAYVMENREVKRQTKKADDARNERDGAEVANVMRDLVKGVDDNIAKEKQRDRYGMAIEDTLGKGVRAINLAQEERNRAKGEADAMRGEVDEARAMKDFNKAKQDINTYGNRVGNPKINQASRTIKLDGENAKVFFAARPLYDARLRQLQATIAQGKVDKDGRILWYGNLSQAQKDIVNSNLSPQQILLKNLEFPHTNPLVFQAQGPTV